MKHINATELDRLLSDPNAGTLSLTACDLSNQDLSAFDLADVSFEACNLEGVNLSGAFLSNFHAKDCNLHGANFAGANIPSATFANCNLRGAKFTGAHGLSVTFSADCDLRDVDATGADFPVVHAGAPDTLPSSQVLG